MRRTRYNTPKDHVPKVKGYSKLLKEMKKERVFLEDGWGEDIQHYSKKT